MKNHTTLPYHLQMIQPTEVEMKAQASLKANKMSLLFEEAASIQELTMDNLHFHLHIAMMLELSTIPPYLCALYSIQTGDSTQPNYKEEFGDNAEVAGIIRSVMMEEMLHLTLVGNILNAVGGPVKLNDPRFIPEYRTTYATWHRSYAHRLFNNRSVLSCIDESNGAVRNCSTTRRQNYLHW